MKGKKKKIQNEVVHAKPIFGNVEVFCMCPVVNGSRDIMINSVCKYKNVVVIEVGVCKGKQNLAVRGRMLVPLMTRCLAHRGSRAHMQRVDEALYEP